MQSYERPQNSFHALPDPASLPYPRQVMDTHDPTHSTPMTFRGFQVWPSARLLSRSGTHICIGSRAFDLLIILLQSRGFVVSKRTIVEYVWRSTIVDDSNLRFQVATLRKALGNDRDLIKSIPGQGYFFACDPANSQGLTEYSSRDRARVFQPLPEQSLPPACENAIGPDRSKHLLATRQIADRDVDLLMQLAGTLVSTFGSLEAAKKALTSRPTISTFREIERPIAGGRGFAGTAL